MLKKILVVILITYALAENFTDITDKELDAVRLKFFEEEDIDKKAHYDLILKPEKADKNKDRRISRDEVRKAILFVIYPKDDVRKLKVTEEIASHVKGQVDLFITNLESDFLTYRQLSKLLFSIDSYRFVHPETLRRTMEAKDQKRESEGEL
jgi:hypothetical protein